MKRRARLLVSRRFVTSDGAILQIKIWELPERTEERPHGLKYSLFFGRRGERIIGHDNEAGKGDHRHYRNDEEPYAFTSMERLIADFRNDVEREIQSGGSPDPDRKPR